MTETDGAPGPLCNLDPSYTNHHTTEGVEMRQQPPTTKTIKASEARQQWSPLLNTVDRQGGASARGEERHPGRRRRLG